MTLFDLENAVSIQKNAFTSYHQLVEYLNTLVYSVQGVDKQPNIRAVLAAQDFYPLMSLMSTVYVFTDSLDEDAGAADFTLTGNTIENQLILKSLAWRNTVNRGRGTIRMLETLFNCSR